VSKDEGISKAEEYATFLPTGLLALLVYPTHVVVVFSLKWVIGGSIISNGVGLPSSSDAVTGVINV
jgi:hypothetical protein